MRIGEVIVRQLAEFFRLILKSMTLFRRPTSSKSQSLFPPDFPTVDQRRGSVDMNVIESVRNIEKSINDQLSNKED